MLQNVVYMKKKVDVQKKKKGSNIGSCPQVPVTFCNIVNENDYCRMRKVPCSIELQVFRSKIFPCIFYMKTFFL